MKEKKMKERKECMENTGRRRRVGGGSVRDRKRRRMLFENGTIEL